MTERQRECLQEYVALLNDLLNDKITVASFEAAYLRKFKSEQIELPGAIFDTLDTLFGDVDAYCPDSAVRMPDGIDEAQLLAAAKRALAELKRQLTDC